MVVLYGIRIEHITSWLEQVQHRAARLVTRTNTEKEGCVTKALKQLNWPTLEKRRQVARLTLMYIKDAIDIACYVHHQVLPKNQGISYIEIYSTSAIP